MANLVVTTKIPISPKTVKYRLYHTPSKQYISIPSSICYTINNVPLSKELIKDRLSILLKMQVTKIEKLEVERLLYITKTSQLVLDDFLIIKMDESDEYN